MATLVILIVGFLHLIIVEPAPTVIANGGISTNILFSKDDIESQKTHMFRENMKSLERRSVKIPVMESRFPVLEDNRQNWGLLVNKSLNDENDDTDYNRPINIPRPSRSNSIDKKDTVIQALRSTVEASTENTPFKQKLLEKQVIVRDGSSTVDENIKRCDVAVITCCIKDLDFYNCLSASQCLNLKDDQVVCEKKIVLDALKRVEIIFR